MTMTLIESKTLTGTQAAIEFTSIPSTFTDLVVLVSGRGDRAASFTSLFVNLNGSSADFTTRVLGGDGSNAVSSTDPQSYFGFIPCASATSNTFGNAALYIPNYTSSANKSLSGDGVAENNATQAFQRIAALLWSNTAAITSLSVYPDVGNFVIGSTVSLYGITKGTDGIVTTS
jgi:hypothetical protein